MARQGHEVDMACVVGYCCLGLQFGLCQQSRALWILAVPSRQYTFIIYKDISCRRNGEHDNSADGSCADSNHRCGGIAVLAAMVDMAFVGEGEDVKARVIGQKDNHSSCYALAHGIAHNTDKRWGGYWYKPHGKRVFLHRHIAQSCSS